MMMEMTRLSLTRPPEAITSLACLPTWVGVGVGVGVGIGVGVRVRTRVRVSLRLRLRLRVRARAGGGRLARPQVVRSK